jgi:hypothetical protein
MRASLMQSRNLWTGPVRVRVKGSHSWAANQYHLEVEGQDYYGDSPSSRLGAIPREDSILATGKLSEGRNALCDRIFPSVGRVWDFLIVSDTASGMNLRRRVARGTKTRTNLVFLRASCEQRFENWHDLALRGNDAAFVTRPPSGCRFR